MTTSAITRIHNIQGDGLVSPIIGERVTVEAIVVGDFQGEPGNDKLRGFYLQEQDRNIDGNPATSEGIFVFDGSSGSSSPRVNVQAGDKVRVTGTIGEFGSADPNRTFTQINSGSRNDSIEVISSGNRLPTPNTVRFPLNEVNSLEASEGMRVIIPNPLTVTGNFFLGRFGQVELASGGLNNEPRTDNRLDQFTQFNDPDPVAFAEYEANNARRTIILDDGLTIQNPDPIIYGRNGNHLSANNTLRGGDIVPKLSGVLDQRRPAGATLGGFTDGDYRIQPTDVVNFRDTNPRPLNPPPINGRVKVGIFNIENYFNGDGMGGGFPTSRGARTFADFQRQTTKIVENIVPMDLDVLGFAEMENDFGDGDKSAVAQLVEAVNQNIGTETYRYIDPGVPQIGTDVIAVALIYQPAKVTPVGEPEILNSLIDPEFNDRRNRPVLAQTFREIATGEVFTVATAHLKSKGASGLNLDEGGNPIVESDDPDFDQRDGQGFWNATRTKATEAIVRWLNTDPTGSGDPDFLVIGDMNAQAQEDPLKALENGGYTTLLPPESYSFIFRGQVGSLDHALANDSLLNQVGTAGKWFTNSDEPSILNYSSSFKSPEQIESLFGADPFRSADHDALLLGLNLRSSGNVPGITINGTNGNDTLDGTRGNDVINGRNGNDILSGKAGRDTLDGGNNNDQLSGGDGDDLLNGGNGNDMIYGEKNDDTMIGSAGRDLFDGGLGQDTARYSGVSSNFRISGVAKNFTIQGPGITQDNLINVELVQFSDGTFPVGELI